MAIKLFIICSCLVFAGHPVEVHSTSTLADGLAVPMMGGRAFEICKHVTDGVYQVTEKDIASAVLHCIEDEKLSVEGGCPTYTPGIYVGPAVLHIRRACCPTYTPGLLSYTHVWRAIIVFGGELTPCMVHGRPWP